VAVISALEISILGAIVVFLTLMALAVLVWLISKLITVFTASTAKPKAKPGTAPAAVDGGFDGQARDLAVIAAVMKEMGVEGELRITRVG
jgi:Na+-transporting methylmalonyl-CoA/oxaloacetate decarboxylase gamma subunit